MSLQKEGRGWVYRGLHPGPGWHGHGYTRKALVLLDHDELRVVVVHKQRWRELAGGATYHDRPPQDLRWSYFSLAVCFAATWSWMTSPRGLLHVEWPWDSDRPSRRTVQRWLRRLLERALAWQVAMRTAVEDALAPRTFDGVFPAGLPPPGTMARWHSSAAHACQLHGGLDLLKKCAPHLPNVPWQRLVVEAHERFRTNSRHR